MENSAPLDLIMHHEPPEQAWVWQNLDFVGCAGEYQAWNWKEGDERMLAVLYFTTAEECHRVCSHSQAGRHDGPISLPMSDIIDHVRRFSDPARSPFGRPMNAIACGDDMLNIEEICRAMKMPPIPAPRYWMWVV
jgi:hypothetical protein